MNRSQTCDHLYSRLDTLTTELLSQSRGSTCTKVRRDGERAEARSTAVALSTHESSFVQGESLARYNKYYISKCTVTKWRLTWPDTTRGQDEGQGKLKCYYIYMSGRTP